MDSQLILLTDTVFPRIQLNYGGADEFRGSEEIDAEQFIGVKGYKAKGKRLTTYQLESVVELEPTRFPAPPEEPEALEALEEPEAPEAQEAPEELEAPEAQEAAEAPEALEEPSPARSPRPPRQPSKPSKPSIPSQPSPPTELSLFDDDEES